MKIFINHESVSFSGSQISYEEVVALASMRGTPSVVYRGKRERSGMMHPGCAPVELDDDMKFTVAHTGNA